MSPSRSKKSRCIRVVAVIFIILSSVGLLAQRQQEEDIESAGQAYSASQTRGIVTVETCRWFQFRRQPRPSSTGAEQHQGPTTNNPGGRGNSPMANGPAEPTRPTGNGPVGGHADPTGAGKNPGVSGGHVPTGISGKPAPNGSQQTQLKNGSTLQKRPNGRVSDLHDAKRGMDIHHGINGSKRVSVERPNHSGIVAERGRPSYVQRGYAHNGHDYARRTYYFHGRAYDRYYRGYPYHGAYLELYAPVRYYPVGFYGWVLTPWMPVVYPWGWVGSPWYGYYGAYFTPYAIYPTPSLWLTDYMISSDLGDAYQAQQEGQTQGMDQQATAGIAPLTPEVKQMIADEVKDQLFLENSEAQQNARNQDPDSTGIARLLYDGHVHVFVASRSLDVVDTAGTECAISDGDALELATPPPDAATSAILVVLSSKGGQECPESDKVTVALTDLQDMQNHMREMIDQGLQELQAKQGTGGLPAAPQSAKTAPVDAGIAKDAPPPDPNGAAVVNQQLADADPS